MRKARINPNLIKEIAEENRKHNHVISLNNAKYVMSGLSVNESAIRLKKKSGQMLMEHFVKVVERLSEIGVDEYKKKAEKELNDLRTLYTMIVIFCLPLLVLLNYYSFYVIFPIASILFFFPDYLTKLKLDMDTVRIIYPISVIMCCLIFAVMMFVR